MIPHRDITLFFFLGINCRNRPQVGARNPTLNALTLNNSPLFQVTVLWLDWQQDESNPETLPLDTARIWHGTLDPDAWKDMGGKASSPNSRILAADTFAEMAEVRFHPDNVAFFRVSCDTITSDSNCMTSRVSEFHWPTCHSAHSVGHSFACQMDNESSPKSRIFLGW